MKAYVIPTAKNTFLLSLFAVSAQKVDHPTIQKMATKKLKKLAKTFKILMKSYDSPDPATIKVD